MPASTADSRRAAGASGSSVEMLRATIPLGPKAAATAAVASGKAGAGAGAGTGAAGLVAGPSHPGLLFLTEPDSPFADGYSIRREEEYLAAAGGTADIDEAHPEYERWLELDERKLKLKQMQAVWVGRSGSDALVRPEEAEGMRRLGALVDEEDDRMEIHTKEGYRLFMGRSKDPGGTFQAIVGGRRIASALKRLWTLTSLDNPYADWALVRHDQNVEQIMQRLEAETTKGVAALEAMKRRGLTYAVVRSAEPKALTLGFKSPYGYTMAEVVVTYDYFVRVMKSLARKNLRSDDQVRTVVREVTRFIRARLNETARFERWLLREELAALSRVDYTDAATAEGKKRIEAASAIFGQVPSEVFGGKVAPRHSRRRTQLTPADRKLLQEASASLAAAEAAAEQQAHAGADALPDASGDADAAPAGLV